MIIRINEELLCHECGDPMRPADEVLDVECCVQCQYCGAECWLSSAHVINSHPMVCDGW